MDVQYFRSSLSLPIEPEVAWAFFANSANLAHITPEWINLTDISPVKYRHAVPGQLITFELRPWGLFPLRWLAEITHVDAPNSFIDQQKVGPFRFWQHRHCFQPIPDGVEIIDEIQYVLPGGPLSGLGKSFAESQLREMFDYRAKQLEDYFGRMSSQQEEGLDFRFDKSLGRWKP